MRKPGCLFARLGVRRSQAANVRAERSRSDKNSAQIDQTGGVNPC